MNDYEKLLDAIQHFRDGLESIETLYQANARIRALLIHRVPLLATPGAFDIVGKALSDLSEQAARSARG